MACCGKTKREGAKPNGKLCPKCGWVMHRVHKYSAARKGMARYYTCSNKLCSFRENIQ